LEAQHPKVAAFDDPVKLNIGGVKYETSLSLLQKFPHSMLGCMFRYCSLLAGTPCCGPLI
jgi:hypothetical protein